MEINLNKAYQVFENYLQDFDRENDRIRLKIVHTYGVIRCMSEITSRMGLSQEDRDLAELIALLHDIGRFEQAKCFDSFEPYTMDHAKFGVNLLFDESAGKPLIRDFLEEDAFDEIIRTAIGQHSLYELGEIHDERTLLHARLIRDADKLDNCRVKLEESLDTLLGMEAEQVGAQRITDKVWQTCLEHKSVLSADRVTRMDYWVSYIAYLYDINYRETYDIIMENNFIPRIIARIPYTNEDTRKKMQQLEEMMTY